MIAGPGLPAGCKRMPSIKACANYFCVYNASNRCTLEQISLDVQGSCEDCIYITLAGWKLKRLRIKTLKALGGRR